MAFSADSDNVAEAQRLAAACLQALQPGSAQDAALPVPLSWQSLQAVA